MCEEGTHWEISLDHFELFNKKASQISIIILTVIINWLLWWP
jgi:hypothetical protein